jgi:hypothetical protein
MAIVCISDKYGFIDKTGKEVARRNTMMPLTFVMVSSNFISKAKKVM